jgi:hypothetical protein
VKHSLSALAALLVLALAGGPAVAGKKKGGGGSGPDKVFSGKILFSSKQFPTSAGSPGAYTAKLKKQKSDRFYENKEKKEWKIYYAAFFRKAYNDLEMTVKLWDISNGRKQLAGSFEQYLDQRGEKVIISYAVLERKFFGVNKKIMMTVEDHRGTVYATGTFHMLGEGEKFTGKVDFSEEETSGDIEYKNEDEEQ